MRVGAGVRDLLLLRHPQVAAPPGWCYGQSDVPLAEPLCPGFDVMRDKVRAGLAELHAAGGAPALQQVVSSPLQRAARPARQLADDLGLPWRQDRRWMELDFGAWEGVAWADIDRSDSDPWAEDPWHRAPPGGETQAALAARVAAACQDWLAAPAEVPGQPLAQLVVAHSGSIRSLVVTALGLAPAAAHALWLPPGGLVWLRHQAAWPRPWQLCAFNR